jgi:AcrR family transcriptional regulator
MSTARSRPRSEQSAPSLAERAVGRRLAPARETAEVEVRALLEAGLDLMRVGGTGRQPRVADIVAVAGLSNDAFYRYFASKDDLVAAVVEDGSRRLATYVEHQIQKSDEPEDQLRLGIEAVLKQASDTDVAAGTRAVLGNSTHAPSGGQHSATQLLDWLTDAFAIPVGGLGSADVRRDARTIAAVATATMQYFLWSERTPTRDELHHLVAFAIAGLQAGGLRRSV